ncbi:MULTISPECIES: ATP-binding protein [Anaeromyxobacter]|uniref:ATP-binding protein n=1 Tax=Anaeromyxobacter TaxID=161492 RepID=UPI001F5A9A3E|nr:MULTISPECIES: ATP-binding protein [unclassified Anaeromyxobacter]
MPDPGTTSCSDCGGGGYVVEQVLGQPARARRCTCQSACPRCGETGYTLVPSGGSMVAQVCSCRHLDERIGVFNQIGIPAAVAKASFDGFKSWSPDHAKAKAVAEDFARKFRKDAPTKGYLLYGRPGAGKTHLLVATLRYLALEKGVAGRYVEFMLLLSDIRSGFDANRGHMEILRPLLSVPVLAIDELGKERGTEWERSMLDELISRRFNSGLATLFATNYFLEARAPAEEPGRVVRTRSPEFQRDAEAMTLAQRVGDRIYSRLNEMCSFVKLDPGHDLRKDRHGAGSGGFWGS